MVVKFNGADLSGAHFFGAKVKGANFAEARFINFGPEELKNYPVVVNP
jgi:uncharacterized protein YjbI with pentapeptide repeats